MRFVIELINRLALALTLFLVLTYTFSFPAQVQNSCTEMAENQNDRLARQLYQFVNSVAIEPAGAEEKLVNICDRNGLTREWMVMAPEQNLRVKREGNILVFSGFRQGIKINKTIPIDDAPWFQPLACSLKQFSDSSRERIEFWHIRTDDLAPVKLAAGKIGPGFGDARVGQMGYLVEILPTGGIAPLWQASFWFRSGDKVFCRYGSRSGAWGTPLAVISTDPVR
jgi:hypothetical protein